jgi:acyl-CoA synthetase (AMP-forming)/AMP-acid ligase II
MNITQGLNRAIVHTPQLAATIFRDRVRTWDESGTRVARLAGALRALGLRPGDRVAMLALNSDRYHEYLLAVPWAGGVLNPVNTRWSLPEIAFSLNDSGTRILLVDDTFTEFIPRLREQCEGLTEIICCGEYSCGQDGLCYEDLIATHTPVEASVQHDDDLAGIFYTGGTTGRPKGVMLTHRNMLTSAFGFAAAGDTVTPGGVFLHAAPLFHLAGIGGWLVRNLLGGTHVMVPGFEPGTVIEAVERHRVTDTMLVPTMIGMLLDAPEAAEADFSSLRHLIYGAAPIAEALLDRVEKLLPGTDLVQAYGMTELAPVVSVLNGADHLDGRLRRSAGRPAAHATVCIVDERGVTLPRGHIGEVVVRGENVMLGYWQRPEETTAALRYGWMYTGDAGYLDEQGYLFIVDRIKDMIVSGGENVYSAEVENALAQHPAVAMCAVIGVPDPGWGERVHAVVVPAPGYAPTADELRTHCRSSIAGYKVPRTVEFVDRLPLSAAGKILKKDLRERYWSAESRNVN